MDHESHYILIEKEPVAVDWRTWAEWFEKFDRRLALTEVWGMQISTVFLGLDHNFFDHGPPLLFETMIFEGPLDKMTWRYSTWEQAEHGHRAAVAMAKDHAPSHVIIEDTMLCLKIHEAEKP